MNSNDLAFFRDALPFWKDLTPAQRDQLADAAAVRSFAAGTSMHSGSEDCAGLFLVQTGQVRVYIFSPAGKEITLYRLFERDICIFSASCMIKDIRFDLYVEAEKDTQAILIPTHIYQMLMKSSLPVSNYTNQLVSSRFSDVMWILEQILFMSFDARLALFLLEQADLDGNGTVMMTHEVIARNLGTAREVVTRMLRYFVSEGMVELSRGGITVTNRTKLEEMSQKSGSR